jgi:hypothetical protein
MIKVTRDGEAIGELPAEFIPLDYPDLSGRADPAIGLDSSGAIYVAIHTRVFTSKDGGRSWTSREVDVKSWDERLANRSDIVAEGYGSFGVLRDGTLLWSYSIRTDSYLLRSIDGGSSWERWGKIEAEPPYNAAYGGQNDIVELPDGTVVWPVMLYSELPEGETWEQRLEDIRERGQWEGPPIFAASVYRSLDGGRTWPERALLQPWGGETNVMSLRSGSLLAAIRYQRFFIAPPPANEPPELAELAAKAPGKASEWPGKQVFFADSTDGGRTWINFRPLWRKKGGKIDMEHGEAHGHIIQLADGRVLLAHEHRYPRNTSGFRARVSHDEGQTWRPEVYHLSRGTGYGASVQIADGTIVTVCGNTPLDDNAKPLTPFQAQVVRWRLPDDA